MARSGVGYIDVVKAAEALRQRGDEPTVDRVRGELGTGSKSTIAPLLKRWRQETGDSPAETTGLPRDLIDALKSLHQRVQEDADSKVQEVREKAGAETRQLGAELASVRALLEGRTEELNKLEQKLQGTIEASEKLQKSRDEMQVALDKSDYLREQGDARIAELKSAIAELKQENRDVRDHFEHFQQQIADDRQVERDQFRLAREQLGSQLAALNEQLNITSRKLEASESQVEAQRAKKLELERELADLVQRDAEKRAVQARQQQIIDELKAQLATTVVDLDVVQKDLASAKVRTELQEKEIGMHSEIVATRESELKSVREKLAAIEAENRQVLQEKAILQGQLVQLQRFAHGPRHESTVE